ncbi:hypothetical protein [Polaromonas sp. JS666]|nr:hypothetical protein [Polaromonas sp. JS666]
MESDPNYSLLLFDHAGFPEGTDEHLETGWHANYWEPLKKYLSSGKA